MTEAIERDGRGRGMAMGVQYRYLYRFLGFAESPTKISGESSKTRYVLP